MKTNEFTDFIKQKIIELGLPDGVKDSGIFDAVKKEYPDVSTRAIMQSIMILSGGDIITVDENGNRIDVERPKNGRSIL